jgi:hypothetical protein
MEKLGTGGYLEDLRHIIAAGPGADRQREIYAEQQDFSAIIKKLLPTFWQ